MIYIQTQDDEDAILLLKEFLTSMVNNYSILYDYTIASDVYPMSINGLTVRIPMRSGVCAAVAVYMEALNKSPQGVTTQPNKILGWFKLINKVFTLYTQLRVLDKQIISEEFPVYVVTNSGRTPRQQYEDAITKYTGDYGVERRLYILELLQIIEALLAGTRIPTSVP